MHRLESDGQGTAILKQGILSLHRRTLPALKKRMQVTLCRPRKLADVQEIYERLFLLDASPSESNGLDSKAIEYLGELSWAASQSAASFGSLRRCRSHLLVTTDTPLLILRSADGSGSPEFLHLSWTSSNGTHDRSFLIDEEVLAQACHWALRLPDAPRQVLKFACQTSIDYLDWIRVLDEIWS